MISDAWSSLKDYIKTKSTNPFFGTFIVVWSLRNWKLVYSLFYFDDSFTLLKRIEYLDGFFTSISFAIEILITILVTITLIVVSYLILSLTKFVTLFYEHRILPYIYLYTEGKASIIEKEKYNSLLGIIKNLEQESKTANEETASSKTKFESLLKEHIDLKQGMANSKGVHKSETEPDKEIATILEKFNSLGGNAQMLKIHDLLTEISSDVPKSISLISDNTKVEAIKLGLMTSSKFTDSGYNITDKGKKLLDYLNNNPSTIDDF